MLQFISLTLEIDGQLGYIRYRELPEGQFVESRRISGEVVADFGKNGELFGIELLSLDEHTLSRARAFATENQATFPRDLSGALAPA